MPMGVVRSAVALAGRLVNQVVSFVVFSALDLLDVLLCLVYKLADYAWESEWKPCYCSSSAKDMITNSGKILVSEGGRSKVVCLCSSSKLQLDDISDTLYSRRSLVADISRSTVEELRRRGTKSAKRKRSAVTTTFTINSTIVQMLQGKIGGQQSHPIPRWSDCDCKICTCWSSPQPSRPSLYHYKEEPPSIDGLETAKEDVLFIHGFISSSAFWTETVFPHFSDATKSRYRLIAVDLLGFGRSPKPADSLYTLREHVDMIEKSILEQYKVKSFHIVAHSLGSILALALAVKYPDNVKSLTLLSPPYFPVPKGEQGTQYVLRKVAPRQVWPMIAFGASIACWYEHISRTVCLLICKNHRLWEFLFKFITRNRMKTFLIEGFMCHTHNAAWHTLHNIICGSAGKIDRYLEAVRDHLSCSVTVIHGRDDELLPVDCSIAVKSKIPRANVRIIERKDHITIIVGREKAFARELEEIWNSTDKCH
ncbi:putative lysophospholipase BODYGUARD 3 [Iris pallida]|uniref:Lysophospholipase BODYGUARD 3 n=1 Tax=Iris pallida TaxID=29817 RepID=A0AAX6EQC3_IRIPA|nr:putative lysophospholipase BODYGUARD 3 [Iris pallida]KAJ6828570.1 putative lysophospholipase BODYGUARD 3 [Iris pallida]